MLVPGCIKGGVVFLERRWTPKIGKEKSTEGEQRKKRSSSQVDSTRGLVVAASTSISSTNSDPLCAIRFLPFWWVQLVTRKGDVIRFHRQEKSDPERITLDD